MSLRKIYIERSPAAHEEDSESWEIYGNEIRNEGGVFLRDFDNFEDAVDEAREIAIANGLEEIILTVD